jgi:cysteine desulfurase/selenocysteine lyase
VGALRHEVVGTDELVPTLSGRMVRYVNLDNAATAPAMRAATAAVEQTLAHYGSVHRGAGHHSRRSTEAYELARREIGRFLGADPTMDTVLFTKNTTEAINKLARSIPIADGDVVVTTELEHHSNDLPWRARAATIHARVLGDGSLDLDHVDEILTRHADRVALLAVSGASNVTGIVPPIHELARRVHRAGGRILVDAAQLAPHRPIDMRPHGDPEHLDFVALSAHKLYAPFGSGAVVGHRDGFGSAPDHRGGGTVGAVTLDEVVWAELPHREEAGTPNLLGVVAFAAAASRLAELGWSHIIEHERGLLRRLLTGLAGIRGVRIVGPNDPAATIGVVPFIVDGLDHGLVAAILGHEHGIAVRSGCFCAHPYVARLLGLDAAATARWVGRAAAGEMRGAPGMVRVGLGLYNDTGDVDRLLDALGHITSGDVAGTYRSDPQGDYHPVERRMAGSSMAMLGADDPNMSGNPATGHVRGVRRWTA